MSPITTIIFLSGFKFGERDIKRFGIQLLKENGFHVEVWDISPAIHPDGIGNVALPDEADSQDIRHFSSQEAIHSALDAHSYQTLFICLLDLNYRTFPIFKKISRPGYSYAVTYINPFPIPAHYYKPREKYTHYLKRIAGISPKHLVTSLINKSLLRYYRFLGVRPATLCLLGGTRSIDFLNTPLDESTKKVWMHSLDYDIYLREAGTQEPVDEKLCVFIEAYFPSDPDRYYHEHTSVFDPDARYYRDLKRFFTLLEKVAGVRIIIAEHPKKHPDLNIVDYGGRERVGGRTASLIKNAGFVLSHDSNAVNYAILFKKPILFLTTHEIEKTSNGQNIHALAQRLGKNVLFIDGDRDLDLKKELTMDEQKYQQYIREYLKNSDEKIPSWQIFADFVKKNL